MAYFSIYTKKILHDIYNWIIFLNMVSLKRFTNFMWNSLLY